MGNKKKKEKLILFQHEVKLCRVKNNKIVETVSDNDRAMLLTFSIEANDGVALWGIITKREYPKQKNIVNKINEILAKRNTEPKQLGYLVAPVENIQNYLVVEGSVAGKDESKLVFDPEFLADEAFKHTQKMSYSITIHGDIILIQSLEPIFPNLERPELS